MGEAQADHRHRHSDQITTPIGSSPSSSPLRLDHCFSLIAIATLIGPSSSLIATPIGSSSSLSEVQAAWVRPLRSSPSSSPSSSPL
nr:hypothetical protein CFP56_17975 [Quercus suber]